MAWAVNPLIELHWRGWGDESVAFDAVSGQTVAFDALEAAALACFEAAPQSLGSLVAQMASDLGVPCSSDLRDRLSSIIDDLVSRGWLMSAAPV